MKSLRRNAYQLGLAGPLLAILLASLAPTAAIASDADDDYPPNRKYLKHCRYDDGTPVPADECEYFRRSYAKEVEARKLQQAMWLADQRRAAQASQNEIAERQRADAEAARRKAEHDARRVAEAEQAKRAEAEIAAYDRDQERRYRVAVAEVKRKCGDDYKNPAIGMPIERIRECVTDTIRITGQLNRADGVVTTYTTNNGWYFHVMGGRVIAWGR